MANYPQLDNCSGVWNLREVYDAVMGGYWRNAGAKGIIAGGTSDNNTPISTIQQINMGSTGNASDFGDLTESKKLATFFSSFNRGLAAGGENPSTSNVVCYIEYATQGNAADFGDLISAQRMIGSCANSTRGLTAGGDSPADINNINYVTIASTGNQTDFGDLTVARDSLSGLSSPTRGLFAGGQPARS